MKKTLVALTVAAFAASSAHAVTVLDADGTKVDFDGSLRVITEKASVKTTKAGQVATKKSSSALRNAGSRFGVKVKHTLGEDFYAIGRLEFRFDKTESRDGFGDLYAKRAYVGLGSKAYGDITFGRQVTIADDLSQTNDYEYGLVSKGDYIPTSGTGVIRYDYKGIEGLQVGVNYNFGQKHKDNGSPLKTTTVKGGTYKDANGRIFTLADRKVADITGNIKNAYGAGVLFAQDNYDVRFAYGHTNYETGVNNKTNRRDGYLATASYQLGDLTLIGDFGYAHEKDESTATKTNKFYVAPGFTYQVVLASKVYGNYFYERSVTKTNDVNDAKEKTHGFLLGVDYKFHKQVVAFVEGKYARTTEYTANGTGYDFAQKKADKAIGTGLRVYW